VHPDPVQASDDFLRIGYLSPLAMSDLPRSLQLMLHRQDVGCFHFNSLFSVHTFLDAAQLLLEDLINCAPGWPCFADLGNPPAGASTFASRPSTSSPVGQFPPLVLFATGD